MGHMNELSTLSNLFTDDIKLHTYFVAKIFPFSLKDADKIWFNNLSPGSIDSPIALVNAFFQKYFPVSAQHADVQKIFDFEQGKGEILPESWARFCSLIRALPKDPLPKNELLDIFYRDFYFRALGSLVVLSFPQPLSFSSVLSKPLSETITSAGTAGCPTVEHL
jgi:hypothetical protein